MKKVIAALTAMVVLIVGTAVGVAVSASHLREKELLRASDVWVALASQGFIARPVLGGDGALAAGTVQPAVFKINGAALLVYELTDASQKKWVEVPWGHPTEPTIRIGNLGSYRNLVINYAAPMPQELLSKNSLSPQEEKRLQTYFETLGRTTQQLRNSLLPVCNTVREQTLQIGSGHMIYTVEQQSYCMPTLVGKETWYDNWVAYRLMDCRYREPQAAIDRQTMISIAIKDSTGRCRRVSDDDRIWNGQGMLAIRGLGGSIQSLTKEPEKITYEITSQRGELRDEAAFIMDLGIE